MTRPLFQLPVQSIANAPAGSRNALSQVQATYGFVPNLMGVLANAPALLEGYRSLAAIFEKSTLTATERQVVLLAASSENGCEYCVAAHTVIAGMQGVDAEVVRSIRECAPIADPSLEALRRFTTEVVGKRGWPSKETVDQFTRAGYTPAQALEVVLGIGLKTLSNYTNHLAATPIDAAFAGAARATPACEHRS
jgi:uncharacterized peroxidase-related enzyme